MWTTVTLFSPVHPSTSPTSSSEFWTPLPVSSATCKSTTTDYPRYCMANCTGWICRSESTTSSVRLFTVVCSARLRHTWRISAHRSPILPVDGICVRLAATSSSFHATVAQSSAVGPSLLRVRWPGTHCLTASEMRLCQPPLSDVIWRLFFLLLLAYQRIRGFAFMRYINPRLIDRLIDNELAGPVTSTGLRALARCRSHTLSHYFSCQFAALQQLFSIDELCSSSIFSSYIDYCSLQ